MEWHKRNQNRKPDHENLYIILVVVGIVLTAFNLRPAITSVGPLVGMIQGDLHLSHWSAGLLMSIPLITFAVVSPLVPKISSRLSNDVGLLCGLCLLIAGILIRTVASPFFLFFGTVFVGVGIAFSNVLLPVVVKDKFPEKFGLMTSVYSTSMGLIASLASGISVPLAHDLDLGWRGALVVWGIPAVLGIIIWSVLIRMEKGNRKASKQMDVGEPVKIWKSPLAWQIALFMGLQSFLFYVTISWLPEILVDRGMSLGAAGWVLSFMQIIGLPASFFIPVFASRFKSQVWIAFTLGIFSVIGYLGLWLTSSYPLLIVSIILIGLALGGNFPLALSYIGFRSKTAKQGAELSGMAQSTGYSLAAIGPFFIGLLFDVTEIWTIPLMALVLVSMILTVFSMAAGRERYV